VLVTKSPYIFAIGLAIGIFLSDASTVTRGAVYGSIIAAPVGLYLILSNSLPGEISGEPLLGFLNVTLFVCFGALYGATLIWIKNRLKKGDRPFF
jgi:hypothetical protein